MPQSKHQPKPPVVVPPCSRCGRKRHRHYRGFAPDLCTTCFGEVVCRLCRRGYRALDMGADGRCMACINGLDAFYTAMKSLVSSQKEVYPPGVKEERVRFHMARVEREGKRDG